jgi:hypothetical protein
MLSHSEEVPLIGKPHEKSDEQNDLRAGPSFFFGATPAERMAVLAFVWNGDDKCESARCEFQYETDMRENESSARSFILSQSVFRYAKF